MSTRRCLSASVSLVLVWLAVSASTAFAQSPNQPSYNQLISSGNDLLKEGKPKEAYAAAMAAAQADDKRFEAYALAALSLHAQGADADAKAFVERSLARVPDDKRPLLNQMYKMINDALATAPKAPEPAALSTETRRQMDVLQLIMEDADKATVADQRNRLLNEFLAKSQPFVKEHPDQANIWALRAAAALELNNAQSGQEAARWLMALGQDNSSEPRTRKILAMLDRKGWLTDKTSADAQNNIGVMYHNAQGGQRDYKEAMKWYKLAAAQGYAWSQSNIGLLYDNGYGVSRDFNEAVKWYSLAAAQGNPVAQTNLGWKYYNGEGVQRDYNQAYKWHKLGAAQGNSAAQFGLGLEYYFGNGVTKDFGEAAKWWKLAADQGHSFAQNNLGSLYTNGEGVPQDYAEALKYFKLSAAQGYAEAQYNLGLTYRFGRGTPTDMKVARDSKEAMKWLKLAAGQGHAGAQNVVGSMYAAGEGVPRDDAEAMKWYKLSADKGSVAAQNNLGLMYQQGVGAPLDYDEAVKWFKLAAAQGDKFGQKKLELLTLYQSSVRALANRPAPSNGPALLVGSVDVSRFGGLRYGDTIERAMQILGVPTGSGANGETSIMFDGVGLTLEYDTSHRITSIEALDLLNPEFLKSHGGLDGLPAMLGQRRDALTPLGSPTKTLPANADEPNGLQDGVWYFTIDGRQGELRICCVNAKPDAEAVGSIGLKWGSPVNPSLQASTSVGR